MIFFQQSSLVQAYRRLKEKCNKSFKHFASPKGLIFFLKIQAIKVDGESPLPNVLNEYRFYNLYCLVFIRDAYCEEKYKRYNILFCLVP